MTNHLVAIKVTSDGKAFVVDQAANAEAVKRFGKELDNAGDQAEKMGAKVKRSGKEVGDAAPPVQRTEEQIRKLGNTSSATAQQMRQVAPQFTDMVTQLAAGQNPLQILIQQGGQLKDVFGGVGPAARALGGYVVGLINPLSVTAAAVGVLGFAWHRGNEESAAFARGVILSGNATGLSTSQYHAMADSLARVSGTKGAALEAIGAFAQSGRIGAENLERFTGIGQQLEKLVAKPVADTAKEFAALAVAPVSASLRLTETYNYLTAAVYQQIQALVDQGEHVEAGKLAQLAFANAMEQRIPALAANLGTLERGWNAVAGAVKKAGDAMLNIGRQETLGDKAQALRERIEANLRERQTSGPSGQESIDKGVAILRERLNLIVEQERLMKRGAESEANRLQSTEAQNRWTKRIEENLTSQLKLEKEIEKIRNEGKAAGAGEAAINAEIANARKKFIDTDAVSAQQDVLNAQIAAQRRAGELMAVEARRAREAIAAEHKLGMANETERITKLAAIDVKQLQNERASLAERIKTANEKKNSRREVSDLEGQLAIKDAEIVARQAKAEEDIQTNHLAKKLAAEKAANAEMAEWQQQAGEAVDKAAERYQAAEKVIRQWGLALEEESKDLQFEISLMGKSGVEQAKLIELRRIDIQLRKELDAIDRAAAGGNLSAEEVAALQEKATTAATQATAQAATKIWISEWTRANNIVADGLYEIIVNRGEGASRTLSRMFEQLVLRPTIMAGMQGVSGAIASMVSGGGPEASTGSGVGSSVIGAAGSSMVGSIATNVVNAYGAAQASTVMTAVANGAATSITTGMGAGITAGLAAIPVWGWIALAAMAIYSYIGGKGGGPKTEAGFAPGGLSVAGTDVLGNQQGSQRGDVGAAQKISEGISGSYAALARQLGLVNQKLDVGVFYAMDNHEGGDSLTQLQVTSSSGYNRGSRTGGIENVERGEEALQAALAEETIRVMIDALRDSDLPARYKEILNAIGDTAGMSEMQAAIGRVTSARQQQLSLEEQLFQMTASEAQKLARIREQERTAVDPLNAALLEQVYAQQDLLVATQAATVAAQEAGRQAEQVASERQGLERQLLQLQGNTSEIRRRELLELDESNRAIQERIWQLEDEKEAATAATAASNAAMAAASAASDAWWNAQMQIYFRAEEARQALLNTGKGISEWIKQLTVTRAGTASPEALLTATRSNYIADLAASRAGNLDAYNRITSSAQAYIEAQKAYDGAGEGTQAVISQIISEMSSLPSVQSYEQQSLSLLQQQLAVQQQTAGVLSSIVGGPNPFFPTQNQGVSIPSYDVGTEFVPYDMIAKVHRGEEIVPAAQNTSGSRNRGVEDRLDRLCVAVDRLTSISAGGHGRSVQALERLATESAGTAAQRLLGQTRVRR